MKVQCPFHTCLAQHAISASSFMEVIGGYHGVSKQRWHDLMNNVSCSRWFSLVHELEKQIVEVLKHFLPLQAVLHCGWAPGRAGGIGGSC